MKRTAAVLAVALAAGPAGLLEGAGTVTGISAKPAPATAGAEVAITVTATGPCQVFVDFGDQTKAAHLTQFPGTVKHVYAAARKYVLKTFTYTSGNEAPGLSRCGGFADMELVVNAKPGAKVLAPKRNLPASGAADSTAMKFQQIPVTPSQGKSAAQDSWQTQGRVNAPSPSPTPTKAAH